MSGGGQRRTYMCACGWGTKDSVRASEMKLKLHKKVCELARMANWGGRPFEAVNGINGIVQGRNGPRHQPLMANNMIVNGAGFQNVIPLEEAMRYNQEAIRQREEQKQ